MMAGNSMIKTDLTTEEISDPGDAVEMFGTHKGVLVCRSALRPLQEPGNLCRPT